MSNHGAFATQRTRLARIEQRPLTPQNTVVTPPQLLANANDYEPVGLASCDVLRLSSDASRNITGFKFMPDGRPRVILNVGSQPIVLINASSSSISGNRIAAVSDITLLANSTCILQPDISAKVWRVIGQELPGTGTSGQVLTSNGDGTLPTFQAGGVTGFTGSQNTSSPNNTVNASRLLVSASSTNADFVAQPKGTGAFLTALPNSGTSGGNKRGINAVDLQTKFTAATQVASGSYGVAIGIKNTASGPFSSVAIGQSNVSSGGCSTVGGGYVNSASGYYSTIPGGKDGTTRSLYGTCSIASGKFGTQGDAQQGQYILRGLTTTNAAKVLTADQGAAGTTNQCILPNNSNYAIRGLASAHRTDAIGTGQGWYFHGTIRRGANAASTTVPTAITPVSTGGDAGAATWTLTVTADTTNGGVAVTFTAENSKTVRCVCVLECTEVTS